MKTWDERAKNYLTWKEGVSPQLIKRNLVYTPLLKMLIARKLREIQPQTILEVGCGTGRLFSLYKDKPTTCVDSSEKMLVRARRLCKRKGYTNIRLLKMDICELRLGRCYDVAISSNVLLHISPDKIHEAVRRICKHASEVICVEWVEEDGVDVGNCYLHDYVGLFNEQGFRMVDARSVPFEKQRMYHFSKEE